MEKKEEPSLSTMPTSKEPEGNWYGLCSDIYDWLEDYKTSLQSRCDECKINPDYCPQECDSKLTPKEILGEKEASS